MKILVCAWRHWTAGRRFRSLLLNAPKVGHEVFGLAADFQADQDLTIAAFNELGIDAFGKEQWQSTVERLQPDVVFGEYIQFWALECDLQKWVNAHGKVGLINNHNPYIACFGNYDPRPEWPRTYFLATSEQQAMVAAGKATDDQLISKPERMFIIGASDLDFVTEIVDIAEVRKRLGVSANQPLIGLFPTLIEADGYNTLDYDEITTLVRECQGAGWQVVIHPHPMQRRFQTAEGRTGFYFYDSDYNAVRFWPTIQALGARFIADYAPGRICGVEFHRCQSFELIRAADCLIGSFDPFFEAYALKKGYVLLSSEAPHLLDQPPYDEMCESEFELQDNFTKVASVLEQGNDIEQDPAFIEKWFFKLDGLWWRRALDVAEQLVKDYQ